MSVIDCFEAVISLLGPDRVGGVTNKQHLNFSTSDGKSLKNLRVGVKRHMNDVDIMKIKRQKIDRDFEASSKDEQQDCNLSINTCEQEQYADLVGNSLLLFIELLGSPDPKSSCLSEDVALTSLCMLCIAFCRYTQTNIFVLISQQMCTWIPWICNAVWITK